MSAIYIVASDHGVKVGISGNPAARLAALQTGSHAELVLVFQAELGDAARGVEREAHEALRAKRLSGEWFAVTPDEAINVVRIASQAALPALDDALSLTAYANAGYAQARDAAVEFLLASKATRTSTAYASDWRHFETWCAESGATALPATPETVCIYLAALARAGRKVATIRRRVPSIAFAHQRSGFPSPTAHPGVSATLAGIERKLGAAPLKKAALTVDLIAKALKKIPDDLTGKRDRALLMVGFAAALRRSEIVALNVNDIRSHPKGLVLTLRRSKTDQKGLGKTKAIPHGRRIHVGEALDAWLAASGIKDGPIFRGVRGATVLADRLCTEQVARIVKARAAAIGLNPKSFAGHSLRSGYISSAADSGATLQTIANHAGHAKVDTTLGYVQVADQFANHSGRKFL